MESRLQRSRTTLPFRGHADLLSWVAGAPTRDIGLGGAVDRGFDGIDRIAPPNRRAAAKMRPGGQGRAA